MEAGDQDTSIRPIPHSQAQNGNGGPRKIKGPNSDTRKEQNRIASRAYRERKRQKLSGKLSTAADYGLLDQPETWVEPDQGLGAPLIAISDESTSAPSSELSLVPGLSSTELTSSLADYFILEDSWTAQTPESDTGNAIISNGTIEPPMGASILSGFFDPTPPMPQPLSTVVGNLDGSSPPSHGSSSSYASSVLPDRLSNTSHITSTAFADIEASYFNPSSDILVDKAIGHSTPSSLPEFAPATGLEQTIDSFTRLSPAQQRQFLSLLASSVSSVATASDTSSQSSASSSSSDTPRPPARKKQQRRPPPRNSRADRRQQLGAALDLVRSVRLPDAKRNAMAVAQAQFLCAVIENAAAIGFPRRVEVFDDDSCSIYTAGWAAVAPDDTVGLAQVRRRFETLTIDLRPVDAQLTAAHHPWLDVIPFRMFRERAMAAITSDPPILDEYEMCDDLDKEGLVCWGSQGSEARGGMGAGVPWDARSWEPALWFLKKYWFLVGSWDEEMWRAARWWHTMRGEQLEVDDVLRTGDFGSSPSSPDAHSLP